MRVYGVVVLMGMVAGGTLGGCFSRGDTSIQTGDTSGGKGGGGSSDATGGSGATGGDGSGGSSAAGGNGSGGKGGSSTGGKGGKGGSASGGDTSSGATGGTGDMPGAGEGGMDASGGTTSSGGSSGTSGTGGGGNPEPECDGDVPVSISAGYQTTCGIKSNGTLFCWGYNGAGQLGTGDLEKATTPQEVKGLCAQHVAVGYTHACAVDLDGAVWCWGDGTYGQLGDVMADKSTVPLKTSVTGALQVAVGDSHGCALLEDGQVKCWGNNGNGQLGDGSMDQSSDPVDAKGIPTDDPATQITAGANHTCVVLDSGAAKCWGLGTSGQLGNSANGNATAAQPVTDLTSVKQISAGADVTCAVLMSGPVKCWGNNAFYQVGLDCADCSNEPQDVGTSGIAVATGGTHVCALTGTGANCWGSYDYEALGYKDTSSSNGYPPGDAVESLAPGGTAIVAGEGHTCVLFSTEMWCWGRNEHGQLGSGGIAPSQLESQQVLDFP